MKRRLAAMVVMALVTGSMLVISAPPALAVGFGEIEGQVRATGGVVDAFEEDSNSADSWSASQTASRPEGGANAHAEETYVETYEGTNLASVDLTTSADSSVDASLNGVLGDSGSSYSLGFSVPAETPFTAFGQVGTTQAGVPAGVNAASAFIELRDAGGPLFGASVSGPGGDSVSETGTLHPGFYFLNAAVVTGVGRGESATATLSLTLTIGAPECTNTFTTGPDFIEGTEGDDVLCGGDGDDQIFGFGGNDRIIGGSGLDRLFGDNLAPTPDFGNDEIDGGIDGDVIDGGPGNDLLRGGAGDDIVRGREGNDTILGGDDEDDLSGDDGDDSLTGGGDEDVLWGDTDPAQGQAAAPGDDGLSGDAGADKLHGGPGEDILSGDSGTDLLLGDEGPDHLFGGASADTLDGGSNHDTVDAGGGDDPSVEGGAGDDILAGGDGRDTIRGGSGSDTLRGQGGRDRLFGNQRKDVLNGGGANDFLNACDGVLDVVTGGSGGDDTARVDRGVDDVRDSTEVVNRC